MLFWKSLPVSDTHMVLSKLAWALVLAPLLAIGIGILIGVAMWLISALTITVNGLPAGGAMFTHSHPLRVIGGVISSLPVYMMWSLPAVGWLMFCSAWARSKPFLWAVLVPVLACVIVSMTDILPGLHIRHDLVWYTVVYRGLLSVVPGAWFPTLEGGAANPHTEINTPDELANAIDLTRSWHAFATADLWIGAAIGVVGGHVDAPVAEVVSQRQEVAQLGACDEARIGAPKLVRVQAVGLAVLVVDTQQLAELPQGVVGHRKFLGNVGAQAAISMHGFEPRQPRQGKRGLSRPRTF